MVVHHQIVTLLVAEELYRQHLIQLAEDLLIQVGQEQDCQQRLALTVFLVVHLDIMLVAEVLLDLLQLV